jgi:predicted nucleotidyltransferase
MATNVYERLKKHYNHAIAHFGEDAVFGVFLYGSWNYGTNLPDSDVDTKCILIPDLYSLAIKPYEVTHLHIDDEFCECMSIMHMVANWKKQNINFLEILYTPYYIMNPKYEEFWRQWDSEDLTCHPLTLEWAEKIARYDLPRAIKSMAGQALRHLKENPNDLKKIMNAMRIEHSLRELIHAPEDTPYDVIICAPLKIRGIRTGETVVTPEEIEDLKVKFQNLMDNADEYEPRNIYKKEVDKFLERFILELIEYRISIH